MRERAVEAARLVTAPLRPLPDFLLIGAQRSGTTTLYEQLTSHPSVVGAVRKEVHYFDSAWDRSVLWYRSHFPISGRRRGFLTGEATPLLLFIPQGPPRVQQVCPEVRLIAVLRDPVERALSHYRHNVRMGVEPLGFADALEAEEGRLRGSNDPHVDGPMARYSYFNRGLYASQLERWWDYFPRAQMRVIFTADLVGSPTEVCNDLFRWLGLPVRPVVPSIHRNRGPETQRPSTDVLAGLRERYQETDARLERLLGRSLPWADGPT